MDDLVGAQTLRDRFLKGHVIDEQVAEFGPLVVSFLPASQRTSTVERRAVWRAYLATEGGGMHAHCLAQRAANPNAVIPPEHARVIVRPLLDPKPAEPLLSGQRLAQYWFTLEEADADKGAMLRFFILAAATQPVFHEAVKLISSARLLTGQSLGDVVQSRIDSVLTGTKPAAPLAAPRTRCAIAPFSWRCSYCEISVCARPRLTARTANGPAAASWPTWCIFPTAPSPRSGWISGAH